VRAASAAVCAALAALPALARARTVALYAATRDHRRVLERYRELTAARLRRHFGLAPDTPLATLIERLRRERRAAPAAIDLLAAGAGARDEAALRAAARALDGLVREATA